MCVCVVWDFYVVLSLVENSATVAAAVVGVVLAAAAAVASRGSVERRRRRTLLNVVDEAEALDSHKSQVAIRELHDTWHAPQTNKTNKT